MEPEQAGGSAAGNGAVLTREFILLFIASFLFLGSLYLLIPVLPLYLDEVAGATTTQVGLLVGVLTFASFLLRPFVGLKADALGRKPFLLGGSTIFIVASLLYIPARSVWTLPFVLALTGAGVACFHTASLTFIGDIAPVAQRGKSQAWFQTSFNLAVMTAPPLGVFLMDRLGYNSVFIAASAAGALSLAVSLFVKEHWLPRVARPGLKARIADIRRLIVLVSVAIFAGTATLGTVEAFIGLFAESEDISHFALFFTISGAVLILMRLTSGKLIDTVGRRLTGFLALILLAAAMFILAVTGSFPVLCLSAIVWGVGFAFCSPSLSAMLMDRVPSEELGSAFGVYTTAFEGGIVFGAMAMGPVVASFGFRHAFALIGCVCLGGAIFFITFFRKLSS
jgi:MFS family permease